MTNYNKWGVGKLKEVKLPDGRIITRQEMLLVKVGETVTFLPQIDDDDHFIYQNTIPIPEDVLISKYGGKLPTLMIGPNVKCTCSAAGVILVEGPYKNHIICEHFAKFGVHQTSETIKDGQLILSDKSKQYINDNKDIDMDIISKRKYLS